MGNERCGYVSDVTGYPRRGRTCCWRQVHRDSHRCIWHADTENKSVQNLGPLKPRPGERLDGAIFRGLSLQGVSWLSESVLVGADFSNTNLREADLSGADLRKCSFASSTMSYATLEGANMEDTIVTDTDLRGADMTNTRLDQANFSSSKINEDTTFGDQVIYELELWDTDNVNEQQDLLESAIRTYRTLENLSQANTFYNQASDYYRQSKDLRRQFKWMTNNHGQALLAELSRWFTGYGNLPMRVIYTSLGVILLWGLVYPIVGGLRHGNRDVVYTFTTTASISPEYVGTVLLKSIFFSTVTFTTLGYGNMAPVGTLAAYFAGIEALLGSILMALLVGVLTRSTWLR
ncbi:ion transporter [halophilic archaeon]|nr:ion transporter [halophilic archaeon]